MANRMPTPTAVSSIPQEKIAMRAYEKWCKRGRPHQGTDKQDWIEAEAELRAELSRPHKQGTTPRR